MDLLKAEIASKRKAVEADSVRPNKYMRRGELERLREEQEQKARVDKKAEEESRQPVVAKERINTTRVSFSTYSRMYNPDIRMENSHLSLLLERPNPRNHQSPHSTFPTKKRFVGSVLEVSLFDCLESPTRIGA